MVFGRDCGCAHSTPSSATSRPRQGIRGPRRQVKLVPLSRPSQSFAPVRRRVDEHVWQAWVVARRCPQPATATEPGPARVGGRGARGPRTYTVKLGRHLWTRGKAVRVAESEANEKQAPRPRLSPIYNRFSIR